MHRALWVCRDCNFTWWTDGKSLIEIISATQTQGCPKKCSGVCSRIYISHYELNVPPAPTTHLSQNHYN